MATVWSLKIKMATCERILKELLSYEKVVVNEAAKTDEMKEKGADPYDLKQQEELKESDMKGVETLGADNAIAEVDAFFQTED